MPWTDEQKAKAIPRIIAACEGCIKAYEEQDFELFWTLSGLVAGGAENLETPWLKERGAEIMANSRTKDGRDERTLATVSDIRNFLVGVQPDALRS